MSEIRCSHMRYASAQGAPHGSAPGSQAIQDGLQVHRAHVAAGGVGHAQTLPALVQLPRDQAAVQALADQQVLQFADVGYVQRRHEVRIRYHLAKALLLGQDMKLRYACCPVPLECLPVARTG